MNKPILLILGFVLSCFLSVAKEYHVSKNGSDNHAGSVSQPFLTIEKAVSVAYAGDTITVHKGVYREWINPVRGGESDIKRILYRAAQGEKVEIKGSEVISGWKKVKDGVWKIVIPNTFFGDYNPYQDLIFGDWFIDKGRKHHTGEVFINGKSLFEVENLENVTNPVPNNSIKDVEGSKYTWYCESDTVNTVIWANFGNRNPNKELVEITTRKTCIYPEKPGINYITIQGFHISQAATQWAAPTAEQIGMVATHWNKGWIIENNVISDSKCNGITLGKERGTGHNVWSADEGNVNRDGNIHYIEVIFNVLRNNWNKENIGSHVVRNNKIFNCEQAGICGSMGAVFSTIENNHIYNIWTKRQFAGWEIGGIKFHAPIDVLIKKNRINDCGRGIWLDWMTQGARVFGNVLYNNDQEDLFIEVNHGPYIVDHNILMSPVSVNNQSQGGAYIHNLITGAIRVRNEPNRFTPYFLPHSIDMAGLTTIYGGDDRFYNNIIVGPGLANGSYGMKAYENTMLPVWMEGNVYFNEAQPILKDINHLDNSNYNPNVKMVEEQGSLYLMFLNSISEYHVQMVTSEKLGKAKVPKATYDNPDGSNINFDVDYFEIQRKNKCIAGPFNSIDQMNHKIKIW